MYSPWHIALHILLYHLLELSGIFQGSQTAYVCNARSSVSKQLCHRMFSGYALADGEATVMNALSATASQQQPKPTILLYHLLDLPSIFQASRTTYLSSQSPNSFAIHVESWPRDMLTHLLDGDCQISLKDSVECWLGILPLKFTLSSRRKFAKQGRRTHISTVAIKCRARY